MGLFEAILIGLQFKRLQKPLVFFMMLVCFIFFFLFGGAIVFVALGGLINGKSIVAAGGLIGISIFLFAICYVCAHFIKKCVH